ncbi:unnamed protein product [Mytilus edulis]|uniref:Uncharacterized protein n=1 Tax=Mytilus edulis TaxID=6550 RepID=A0A8S3R0J9_MYTED|nr:unnamed protein product [Mytilus edulis]
MNDGEGCTADLSSGNDDGQMNDGEGCTADLSSGKDDGQMNDGNRLAVDIIGNCCPAGHYQTVTSWLREQGTKEPEIPISDLINVFDNEQVIGRKSAIRPNQKHKQNEENENTDGQQELLNSITSEMMSQSSKRIIKMERDHFEQLYYFVNAAIEVVKQEPVLEGDKIEVIIDQKVAIDALDDLMMQCATCGTEDLQ